MSAARKPKPTVTANVLSTIAAAVTSSITSDSALAKVIEASPAMKPSEVITMVPADPKAVMFRDLGKAEATEQLGWIARTRDYATMLQGVTFAKWEEYRNEWQAGAIGTGYAKESVPVLWRERVTKPLEAAYSIKKPASPKSSNQRDMSDTAKAKLEQKQAYYKGIRDMTDDSLNARVLKAKDDAPTMADLYAELAKRKITAAKTVAKDDAAKEKTMRESIADLLKGMTLTELTQAHKALAGIIAKRK